MVEAHRQAEQVEIFDERLAMSMPGSYGYCQASSKAEIDRVLEAISDECESYGLWWTTGRSHLAIQSNSQALRR